MRHSSITLFCRVTPLLSLILIFLTSGMGIAQNSPLIFWELPQERVNPMLLNVPDSDNQRYIRLQRYFSALHCDPKLMEEISIKKHAGRNLACTLSGTDAAEILIVARYEHRTRLNLETQGWPEALMLPLLYNALQAQPRKHTFVFEALFGNAGERNFIDALRNGSHRSPIATVVLDTLGLAEPRFYTVPAARLSKSGRKRSAINKLLESDAAYLARLQGIPPQSVQDPPTEEIENSILFEADKIPSILIYSLSNKPVLPSAFHQEFEFLAYFLCKIDGTLKSVGDPAN
jgi:hypothetical protein